MNDSIDINNKTFFSVKDIRDRNKLPEWLVDGFLMKNKITLFASGGGIGKSTLSLYMACSLALDKDDNIFNKANYLFDRFRICKDNPRSLNSLFLQTENDEDIVNQQLGNIINGFIESTDFSEEEINKQINNRIFFANCYNSPKTVGKTFLDNDFFEWLSGILRGIRNNTGNDIDIIFIDPLSAFCDCDENDNIGMRKHIDIFSSNLIKKDITPIFIHHNKKSEESYRGAGSIRDSARCLYQLYLESADNFSDITLKQFERIIGIKNDKSNIGVKLNTFNLLVNKYQHFRYIDFNIKDKNSKNLDKLNKKELDLFRCFLENKEFKTFKNLYWYYEDLYENKKIKNTVSEKTARRYLSKFKELNLIEIFKDGNNEIIKMSLCF